MATVRMTNEVLMFKQCLDKFLGEGNFTDYNELVFDALSGLQRLPMTMDVLSKTKIGLSVNSVKKKYVSQQKIYDLAKDIVQQWKKVYEASVENSKLPAAPPLVPRAVSNASVSSAVTATTIATVITTTTAAVSVTSSAASAASAEKPPAVTTKKDLSFMLADLSEARKNVVKLFADCLKDEEILEESAISVARIIEASIDGMHSFHTDRKTYQTKAKNLIFNLQQNKVLCEGIASGEVDPESLVLMTNEELASEEKRLEAERAQKEHLMSRDLDWAKNNRDKIMRANGLDPNADGEFVCRKCKGTKTSHYALQTRSSDEPMTIFVTCLTCGQRWRS